MITKEELSNKVGFILGDGFKELQLFGFIAGEDSPYRISLSKDLEHELINVFAAGVKNQIVEKEYVIVNFSSADERTKRYYLYDLEEKPERMSCMSYVIGNHNLNTFDFDKHSVGEINTLIASISDGNGNTFTVYKVLSQVEKVVKSSRQVLAKFGIGNNLLIEQREPLLKISPSFQIIYTEEKGVGSYVFLESSVLEGQFNLHQVLKNQATRDIAVIQETHLLKDVAKLHQHMEKSSFCKKLVKVISTSRVIKNHIPKDDVLTFIDNDEDLRKELKISEENGERFIDVTSLKSAMRLLDLLNDEFLYSALTNQKYQAPDKEIR